MEVVSKSCTKCNQEKPLTEFNNQKAGKYGKRATCRVCQNAENRAYKQTPRGIELRHEWKCSEVGREGSRRYRRNNKDKTYAYGQREYVKVKKRIQVDNLRFGGNRIKTLERDNYKCIECGSDYLVQVHHKDEMGRNKPKELRNNDMCNLTTLCARCHITQHNPVLKRWAKV